MINKILKRLFKNKVGLNNYPNLKEWVESNLINIENGKKILDAGAGELRYKPFCKHLDYVSQDFCEYSGEGNQKGLQEDKWDTTKIDIVSDITNIPISEKSFDVILCSEVFEHIPNPVDALKEFNRILKDDGMLILTVPYSSLTHFAPYHYYSGFNIYFFEYHLKELGFQEIDIKINGNYFEETASLLRGSDNVATKYSSDSFSFLENISLQIVLKALNRFSQKSRNSEELLSHGIFVKAKK